MPDMASICAGVWIRVGSRYEPAELNGIHHFIEHMIFKGTARRSAHQITQAVEGIGGSLDAFTGEESTCIYARAHADHLGHVIEVMFDMLTNSIFQANDIAKERSVIKEELAMYLDQPQHLVDDLVCETLWPNHALGRPLTGTPKTIDRFRRSRTIACHRSNYVAQNTIVALAGNVTHARAVSLIKRHERRLRAGPIPSFAPATDKQTAPSIRLQRKNTAQAQIAFAVRTCSRHDNRRYAVRLLNTILGENMSSRLFQVVREDEGLAYNIHSCVNSFHDTGSFVIYAGVDPDQLRRTVQIIVRELHQIASRPPGAREFRAAKDFLIGHLDLGLEGTENQMIWLGEHLVDYGKAISPAIAKRRLAEVTAGQVQNAAKQFFRADRANLALVSPVGNEREFLTILERL